MRVRLIVYEFMCEVLRERDVWGGDSFFMICACFIGYHDGQFICIPRLD